MIWANRDEGLTALAGTGVKAMGAGALRANGAEVFGVASTGNLDFKASLVAGLRAAGATAPFLASAALAEAGLPTAFLAGADLATGAALGAAFPTAFDAAAAFFATGLAADLGADLVAGLATDLVATGVFLGDSTAAGAFAPPALADVAALAAAVAGFAGALVALAGLFTVCLLASTGAALAFPNAEGLDSGEAAERSRVRVIP